LPAVLVRWVQLSQATRGGVMDVQQVGVDFPETGEQQHGQYRRSTPDGFIAPLRSSMRPSWNGGQCRATTARRQATPC